MLLNNISLYEYTSLFICLSVDGHLVCFQFYAIINKAVNILVQIFLWTCASVFLGKNLWRLLLYHTVGSYLTFKEIAKVFFLSGHTILHSSHQCLRFPVLLHFYQYMVWLVFLILDIMVYVYFLLWFKKLLLKYSWHTVLCINYLSLWF